MKIFSPVNHQATPPLTNPAHLLWHSGEEWRRSCSRPGYVLDSDCPGEGPKTALTNTRSSFQVLFAAHCLMLPIRSHSQRTSWRKMRAAAARGGRIGGRGGAAGSSTVHEGFPFLFSKICTRERSMLITCAQQAMMIYCERHEAEIKESQSEISQSGIEYVGELFTESVYKVDETSPREAELRSSPVCF